MPKLAALMFAGFCLIFAGETQAQPSRGDFLQIAEKGWVFDYRSSRFRHDPGAPPVLFNGKTVATGGVCLFGDPPHPISKATLKVFSDLLRDVFGRRKTISFVGGEITDCPARQRVYIRLYHGLPSGRLYNADLRYLDDMFEIGLPRHHEEPIFSPAQANGFFGRNGAATHMMIMQPGMAEVTPLEHAFYASILIEELFQVFTFGMDILKFDRETPFYSKLQEYPTYLRHVAWDSERFMQGLLRSNPKGLCGFDVFMLHALATTTLATTNTSDFLDHIRSNFDALLARANSTLSEPSYGTLLDPDCSATPD